MNNTLLKILAPLSLVFLFVACGDDSSSSPDPEGTSSDSAYSQPASDSDEEESSDSVKPRCPLLPRMKVV